MQASTSRNTWSPIAIALMLGVVAVLTFWRLWPVLHSQWTSVVTYSHGYLLGAMAIWLVWQVWRRNPPTSIGPAWPFAVTFAGALLLLTLLDLLFLNVPRLYLLPVILVTCVAMVFGREAGLKVAVGASLIYCALPVWEPIVGILQSVTTSVVTAALTATGIPIYISGNFVTIPAGRFEIAEGCSGLRYLIVALALAYFYAFAWLDSGRSRLALIAAAVVTALISNWIRVYSIILIGHVTEMQSSLVRHHNGFGWVVFLVCMLPVFLLAQRLQQRSETDGNVPETRERVVATGRMMVAAVVAAMLLVSARIGVALGGSIEPAGHALPSLAGPRFDKFAAASSWQPRFDGAEISRAVLAEAPDVEVYLAAYPLQTADQRLIAYFNSFVSRDWQPVSTHIIHVQAAHESFEVLEYEGVVGGTRRLVWGWYKVAGVPAVGPIEAKALELLGLLKGRRDAVAVAISTECVADDCRAAKRHLAHVFVSHSFSDLRRDES